jgi:hypothetical protein
LSCFHWHDGLLQWHQCALEVTALCKASQRRDLGGAICIQRPDLWQRLLPWWWHLSEVGYICEASRQPLR